MKVYPNEDDTFTLSELWSALQLIRNKTVIPAIDERSHKAQNSPTRADADPVTDADDLSDDEFDSLADVAAISQKETAEAVNVQPPAVQTILAPHASSSASSRWYTITVGRETGVFQGWHSVHTHVVGVPGACFGRHSSRAVADEVYEQAVVAGRVTQVPA